MNNRKPPWTLHVGANRDSKVRGVPPRILDKLAPDTALAVAIKVKRDKYVPQGVQPLMRMSGVLFTARVTKADLERLEQDEGVISVQVTKQLKSFYLKDSP